MEKETEENYDNLSKRVFEDLHNEYTEEEIYVDKFNEEHANDEPDANGKVPIMVSNKSDKQLDELSQFTKKTKDEVMEEALKQHITRTEIEMLKPALGPFIKLQKTVELNTHIIDKDAPFEAFQKFKQVALASYIGFLNGNGMFAKQFEGMDSEERKHNPSLIQNVGWILDETKIFNIPDEIHELIEKTDNKIYFRKLPFKSIYINKEFKFGEIRVFGICLLEIEGVIVDDGSLQKGLEVIAIGMDEDDEQEFYNYFQITDSGIPNINKKQQLKELDIITFPIVNYVCNFLDLLNHPNIKYEMVEKKLLNETRIKKGKLRINDIVNINVSGNLYKYVYEELPKQKIEFTHRFWVRGHFKHFKNKEKFNQIYKLSINELNTKGYQMNNNIICKWTFPFIRGNGAMINKRYNMKIKENVK